MESSEEAAVCEYCNNSGPRESFYSNSKRFCSAACSHSFSAHHRFNKGNLHSLAKPKLKTQRSEPFLLPSESERHQCITMGFDWGGYMLSKKAEAASAGLFQHAPMAAYWAEIGNGMKVEVLNLDCNLNTKVYWIASVVQVAGYKARLRYEGFGDDGSCDFWCNLCTLDVNAVGWCATIGKPLVPPQTIQHKYSNWKGFLVKKLTGAKTLPNDFQKRVVDSVKSQFLTNMRLEVVDKTKISRMRVGIVEEIVGGRLRLRYEDSDYENDDFWCHSKSALIHPIGWCEKVSHKIFVASRDYKIKKGFRNAKPELFAPVRLMKSCGFKVGMKLEAIDPLNLSTICVATVKKVLKNGFLMIGIDGSEAADGSDWFCYHCTAPSIFPVGFCKENGILLSVPKKYKEHFSWEAYLNLTDSLAAPVEYFETDLPDHGFKRGMKLEAVDLMEPRLICVATVTKVIGRLLQVHFDGWENQYDQWVDCESPDIYPVGWCELVGYELQPPPNMQAAESSVSKKKKLKGQSFTSKKKRKRAASHKKQPDVAASENQTKGASAENESERMDTSGTSETAQVTSEKGDEFLSSGVKEEKSKEHASSKKDTGLTPHSQSGETASKIGEKVTEMQAVEPTSTNKDGTQEQAKSAGNKKQEETEQKVEELSSAERQIESRGSNPELSAKNASTAAGTKRTHAQQSENANDNSVNAETKDSSLETPKMEVSASEPVSAACEKALTPGDVSLRKDEELTTSSSTNVQNPTQDQTTEQTLRRKDPETQESMEVDQPAFKTVPSTAGCGKV